MSEEHEFKYTQYLIVNSDLKEMRKGKMAVQCCHASLSAFLTCTDVDIQYTWLVEGARKIVLKASEMQILELYNKLRDTNIPAYIVRDFGLTQVPEGSTTALGIGPYDINILKDYVKDFKLV